MRARSIVVVALTGALMASTLQAQAAGGDEAVVQDVIVEVTGEAAVPVEDVAVTDEGTQVVEATTPAGAPLETLVQDRGGEGYAIMAVLDEGQSKAEFDLDLPAGTRLEPGKDGQLVISDGRMIVGIVEAPWAADAAGESLGTGYTVVDDDTVQQTVDTRGAQFPVVADPSVSFGYYWTTPVYYVKYNRSETQRIAGATRQAGIIITAACAYVPNNAAKSACSVIAALYYLDIYDTAVRALAAGRCLKVRYPVIGTHLWAYDAYIVTC